MNTPSKLYETLGGSDTPSSRNRLVQLFAIVLSPGERLEVQVTPLR